MIGRCVAAGVVLAVMTSVGAQEAVVSGPALSAVSQQKKLVEMLLDVEPQMPTSKRTYLNEQLLLLGQGKPLSLEDLQDKQREVDGKLKPVPIQAGELQPRLIQVEGGRFQALTGTQQKLLLERSASVARIEIAATTVLPRGTGFRVGRDLLATNCHVLAEIADLKANGQWELVPGVKAHFADGPADHGPRHEFEIDGVAGYSRVAGLDVALLRLRTDASYPFPSALKLSQAPVALTSSGLAVAVVGYPDFTLSREPNFVALKRHGKFAKVYSPGAVLGVTTVNNVGLLEHVASTTVGSSGSPLFATDTFDVIGIHHCCTAPGRPQPAKLPCAGMLAAPASVNVAIAATSVRADPTLSPLLGGVTP